MVTYVALLRGVNVGGHKRITMAELRRLFEGLGFGAVQTYIQSGNVVFTSSDDEDEAALRVRIERVIAEGFGFQAAVVLRTAAELEQVVARCPFAPEALADGASLYVALLAEAPPQASVERLLVVSSGVDEARVVGRDIYLLYRQSVLDSKLTNAFLEKTLGVAATTRNWRTISTLADMSRPGGDEANGA